MTTPPVSVAYVLAAGLGTRLRPLTHERPKPLVEVCGTPLIEFALKLLEDAGVKHVGINSHWLHPQIPKALGSSWRSLSLHYTHEPGVLGTGGGLQGLAALLPAPAGEKVLVLNADALIDIDMRALIAADRSDALATLVLRSAPDAKSYGALGTDEGDRITTFAGRIDPVGPVVRERMFCGVHLVDPRAFTILPPVELKDGTATGAMSGINDDGYPNWMKRGERLYAFDMASTFCDVGTPERLLEANLAVLSGAWASHWLRPFERLVERAPRVWISPSAQVSPQATLVAPLVVDDDAVVAAGTRIEGSVIGKRCRVESSARLARCVLQSGAVAADDVHDAIVAPTCRMTVSSTALGQPAPG